MENVVYGAEVTEYEAGWGQRNDGYLLANSQENFEAGKKNVENGGSYECFSRVGTKKLMTIKPEMYAKVKEKGFIWIGDAFKTWYVEG